jgi:hypothetical protein
MMKQLLKPIIISTCVIFSSQIYAQSTAKIFANGKETTTVVPNTDTYKLEFPVQKAEAAKTFNSPMIRTLEYRLLIGGGEAAVDLDNIHGSHKSFAGAKSWKKFAKKGGVVTLEIDGKDVNDALRRLKSAGWPDKDHKFKIWIEATKGLKGGSTVISEAWITIPLSLKSSYMASNDNAVLKSFKNGNFSNSANAPALNTAIEKYMEHKWPNEDITTVNLQSIKYTNVAKTAFDFEATWISKSNGTCSYNSCYGNGTKAGSKFSISFFNSMNADKTIGCNTANKLVNR